MNLLEKIVQSQQSLLAEKKQRLPLTLLRSQAERIEPRPSLLSALLQRSDFAVIAEFKTTSPITGAIKQSASLPDVLADYVAGGAAGVSIITEQKYFHGNLETLQLASSLTTLPLLRKDFIIDPYQVYEAKLAKASAILLIAQILTVAELQTLAALARQLSLEVLFEAHTAADLEKISKCEPQLVGLNARNLETMAVDLTILSELIDKVPPAAVIVAESGIRGRAEVEYIKTLGIKAGLVGTSLMTATNRRQALMELCG